LTHDDEIKKDLEEAVQTKTFLNNDERWVVCD